jgi:hypothetical protein
MNRAAVQVVLLLSLLLVSTLSGARCTDNENGHAISVPRLVRFSGTMRDAAGKARTGTIGVLFAIYSQADGGAPLWQETQNVQPDDQGRYHILLGASSDEGLPAAVFASGPRWLGVRALPDDAEQPRVLLVSVPFALRAADAETLGGLPASAFAKVGESSSSHSGATSTAAPAANTIGPSTVMPGALTNSSVTTLGGQAGAVPRFSTTTSIGNSQISDVDGVVTMRNLSNTFYADRFSNGVAGALAACPAAGCTIYAGGTNVNRNLGTIDPGNKIVTIYLGPFSYSVNQITLRKGLKIIGMGASIPGTILQSVNGNEPVFVIPQANFTPATDVLLSGLRIVGSDGNTNEDAFFIDASSLSDAGLWYSTFHNLYIYNFAGVGIHLKGATTNFYGSNQWNTFNNVVVYRTKGGGNALRIEGSNFQLHFTNCEFDGQALGDGTNIYVGNSSPPSGGVFAYPFDITFRGLVSQTAAVGVQLDGAETVAFQTAHHELLWGAYLITNNSGIGTRGISIYDSVFNSNVGVNNGTGYLLKVDTTNTAGIYFFHNRLASPDMVVSSTNLAQVVYQDNEYLGSLNVPPTAGITTQMGAATSINIGGAHTVGLNTSANPIRTIQSSLGPGEMVTFLTLGGPVTFATGGNISLAGASMHTVNGTITFIRNDLNGTQSQWWPVSQWTSPWLHSPLVGRR